jgi:hypothetical protein
VQVRSPHATTEQNVLLLYLATGGPHMTTSVPIATHPRLLLSASLDQEPKVEVTLV